MCCNPVDRRVEHELERSGGSHGLRKQQAERAGARSVADARGHIPASSDCDPCRRRFAADRSERLGVACLRRTSCNRIRLSKKAQTLAVEERAQLAQELLESVERDADPEVQAAWETEIAERVVKYERGEANLIPAEEVFAAARRLTQ